jgi:hypothetical protein
MLIMWPWKKKSKSIAPPNALTDVPDNVKAVEKVNIAQVPYLFKTDNVFISDSKYVTLNYQWLLSDWKSSWNQFLNHREMTYTDNQWDCDNFAFQYWLRLQEAARLTPHLDNAESAGVGVIYYAIDGDMQNCHAINIVFIAPTVWIAVEPQTGDEIDLSEIERDSIMFVHM